MFEEKIFVAFCEGTSGPDLQNACFEGPAENIIIVANRCPARPVQ